MTGYRTVILRHLRDESPAEPLAATLGRNGQKEDVAVAPYRREAGEVPAEIEQMGRRPPVGVHKEALALFQDALLPADVLFEFPGFVRVVGDPGTIDAFLDRDAHYDNASVGPYYNFSVPLPRCRIDTPTQRGTVFPVPVVESGRPVSTGRPTMSFELRPHTADVAVAATGRDLDETFAAAGDGLAAATCDDIPERGERFSLTVRAEGLEALLFDYLDRLIYERDVRGVLPASNGAAIHEDDDEWLIEASAQGVPLDAIDARDVKAVTYSEMRIERVADGWEAYVVLDV